MARVQGSRIQRVVDRIRPERAALAPAVAAHGVVYLPVPNDVWNGDPALLAPAPGIIVEIRDSKNKTQLVLTDAQGSYRFAGLPTGGYSITARNNNGDQLASVAGTLVGPDGNDNAIPSMILDAGPPRLLSIAPPPGFEGVSRTAAVELVFSEPLLAGVLPNNAGTLAGWIASSQHLKPGNLMPSFQQFKGEELRALAQYLESLK